MTPAEKPKYNSRVTGTDEDLDTVWTSYNSGSDFINAMSIRIAKGHTGYPFVIGTDGLGGDYKGTFKDGRVSVHTYRRNIIGENKYDEAAKTFNGEQMSEHFKIELVPVRIVKKRKEHEVKEHTRTIGTTTKGFK